MAASNGTHSASVKRLVCASVRIARNNTSKWPNGCWIVGLWNCRKRRERETDNRRRQTNDFVRNEDQTSEEVDSSLVVDVPFVVSCVAQ